MNGFIAHINCALDEQACLPSRLAPLGDGVRFVVAGFDGRSRLLTWGGESGDIHVTSSGPDTFLVLSGHIDEVKGGPTFGSQDEAVQFLLAELERSVAAVTLAGLLPRLHGSFGILYHNAPHNITLVASDRVASRPLWRSPLGGGWIVSSHVSAVGLANSSLGIDPTELGVFLLYGGPITPTQALRRGVTGISPGSVLRLAGQGAATATSWYQLRHEPNNELSRGEWLNLAAERIQKAASRLIRANGNPAIFFSGGADSRLAAAALKSVGGDPLLISLGDGANMEVKVARLAAKAMGLKHEVVLRDPHWYMRSLKRAVYETGGNYLFTHGHFSSAARKAVSKFGVQTFMLGDFFEAFSKLLCVSEPNRRQLWSSEEFVNAFDSLRLPLYRPNDRGKTFSLIKYSLRAEVEHSLRVTIADRYESVKRLSQDPLIVGDLCFRWENVAAAPTFFMFMDLRSSAAERNLMFDPDVQELIEMMPASLRNGRNFGAGLIGELNFWAACVMNSNSLLPMLFPPFAHQASKAVKPLLGRVRRRVFGDSHRTTGSWPEHAYLYLHDPSWRQLLEEMLGGAERFDPELFDRDAVRTCWTSFKAGDVRRAADVEKLLQIALLRDMEQKGASSFVAVDSDSR